VPTKLKKKLVSFKINLVPKDPFFNTILGKTLKWALSVGRYIVIFTELVVILSFVTRFTLDRQVTDLNNAINQKQTVISSFGDLEKNVRIIQAQIENYIQIEQQTNIAEVFPALSEITPPTVQLDQLIIKAGNISFTGTAKTQEGLNTLITNIQLSPAFADVEINKIESSKDQAGLEFTIQARTTLDQGISLSPNYKDNS
jgi:Tfp pilus assembly protein PilN